MILSDLLGLPVIDAESRKLGTVVDVRLAAPPDDHQQVPMHLVGLVVSPHTRSNYLGYERTDVRAPRLLAWIMRWRHRETFLAAWDDVARVDMKCVTLRDDFRRYSARLYPPAGR